ncbi:hypothetical protein CK203_065726 [Vitis vinifera]|uniref:Uncharacterized protein n=1 Tax=Vitis vinifera TaxID=29760 RepID=A0A438FPD1_VITVI|nr:hypothetical protein CK203_065726 [Vitis vinifera]
MKKWHDQLISNKEFQEGQKVLMYDTRLHIFPGKLKSRWIGPFVIHRVYSNGVVELLNSNGKDSFRVNGYRLSHSWSHSNQKRRQSTSLNLKKPKCVLIVLMIPGGRNFKELKEKNRVEIGAETEQKQGKNRALRNFAVKETSAKWHFVAKPFRNTVEVSEVEKRDFAPKVPFRRVFRNCESGFGTRVPLRSTVTSISQLRNSLRSCCENGILLRNWRFVAKLKLTLRLPFFLFIPVKCCEKGFKNQSTILAASSSSSSHAVQPPFPSAATGQRSYPKWHEREGQIFIPSNRKRSLRKEPSPGSVPEPAPKPSPSRPNPPPVKPAPPKPPARRYLTVASSSLANPLPIPSPVPSPAPRKSSGASSANSSPKLQLKHLWKNIQSEARACPIIPAAEEISYGASASSKDFSIPGQPNSTIFKAWANPTELEMVSTLQRSCKSITSAEGELPPVMFLIDAFLRHNIYPLQHWTQRRGVLLEACSQEEASKSRLHSTPLPKAAMPILEHLGYPSEPQLERKEICREPFTLDKWNNMTDTKLISLGSLSQQQGEPPQDIPEGITLATPAIPRAHQLHLLHHSHPHQLSRGWPSLYLNIESCAVHWRLLQLPEQSCSGVGSHKACQEQMLASQAQQAAILRQLQVHFDLPQAVEPSTDTPPEPHSQPSESHPPEPEAPADPPTEEADPSA